MKEKQSFDAFMLQVDIEVEKLCGFGYDDLPDYDFSSAYEDGYSPAQTAKHVIKNAGGF